MSVDRTHFHRPSGASYLRRASSATLLSLMALPAAAQTPAWVRQISVAPGPYTDFLTACAPVASGGVYVAGWVEGSQGPLWLGRYASSGSPIWTVQFGKTGFDYVRAACLDGGGGVYIGGETGGDLAGSGWQGGIFDAWLARYDSGGNQLWIRQLGTSGMDIAEFVAPDASGGVFVGGFTMGSLAAFSLGTMDFWLARYDSAGSQLWVRQVVTSSGEDAYAAAPDGSGGVYVTGSTTGIFGGASAGGDDAWLARYDGMGTQVWIRQLGTSEDDSAKAAAQDGFGGVYVAGQTNGSLGGTQAGGPDAWVARYDSAGNLVWTRQLGTSAAEDTFGAAADSYGGVYLAGSTEGSLGGSNAGKNDAWVARYDGTGTLLWVHQLGTAFDNWASAAAIDGSGGVYVGGRTGGNIVPSKGLGDVTFGGWDGWLARYNGPCVGTTYCTPKVNSNGCAPRIAADGTASASASNGFVINTSKMLDNKFGSYFYSKSGPNGVPFQGGTLCAQLPLVRTALQNSGGTPPCGGSFQIDFNAYIASGKDPGLVAGQQVWVQTWSRDPGYAPPSGTSLSDAISFTICP